MRISEHAYERAEERLNLGSKAFDKLSLKALDLGLSHHEATGSLKRFLDQIFQYNGRSNNTKIYGEHVYLFHNATLITVYQLPNDLKKIAIKLQKRKKESA